MGIVHASAESITGQHLIDNATTVLGVADGELFVANLLVVLTGWGEPADHAGQFKARCFLLPVRGPFEGVDPIFLDESVTRIVRHLMA
jgi:hypothetical protein